MREILFRGKIPGIIDWVYGYYAKSGDDHFILLDTDSENNFSIVAPQTVGQYTGLKDQNGTRIFEGDIIRCSLFGGREYETKNYEIGYDDKNSMFLARHGVEKIIIPNLDLPFCKGNTVEVIGNIHDNPELLEVEE